LIKTINFSSNFYSSIKSVKNTVFGRFVGVRVVVAPGWNLHANNQ